MSRSTRAVQNSIVPEFYGAALGDQRRSQRLVAIAKRIEAEPRAAFPSALQSSAELEGFYRFVNNPDVEPSDILAPHRRAALERAKKAKKVVVVHDTTTAEFSGRQPRRGLGITTTKARHGFLAHVSLALQCDSGNTPLGVLQCETFTRTGTKWSTTKKSRKRVRDDPHRESLRWWRAVESVETASDGAFEAIHVMDAEADFYELLYRMVEAEARFVVRAGQHQRFVRDGEELQTLREVAERLEARTWRTVSLSARRYAKKTPKAQAKRHPGRDARKARLAIASTRVQLRQTHYSGIAGGDVELNLVRVWEPDPPLNTAAVEWLLLTTESIKTKADLKRVVDLYRARWIIEEYFKALKTGCAFEKRQLDSYATLTRALSLFAPVAFRLLLLRGLERQRPNASPRAFFSDIELHLLRADDATQELPPLRNLSDAMLYLARMGGHLKHNGPPGWQTLARGYERLEFLRIGWEAAIASKITARSDQS